MRRFLFLGWAGIVIAMSSAALAQVTFGSDQFGGLVDQFCANHGALIRWGLGLLGTTGAASILANFESKLPPTVRTVVHVLALNLFAIAKQAAEAQAQNQPPPQARGGGSGTGVQKLLPLCALVLVGSALVACSTPQPVSTSPAQDVLTATAPLGTTIQQGLLDAEWNLDQAIAIGVLPANDPADACLHQGLTAMGLEPSTPGGPAPTPASFVPKESDLVSIGSVLYIRAQQAKALGVGGTVTLPPGCDAIIGRLVVQGAAAAKSIVPGGQILPTIR